MRRSTPLFLFFFSRWRSVLDEEQTTHSLIFLWVSFVLWLSFSFFCRKGIIITKWRENVQKQQQESKVTILNFAPEREWVRREEKNNSHLSDKAFKDYGQIVYNLCSSTAVVQNSKTRSKVFTFHIHCILQKVGVRIVILRRLISLWSRITQNRYRFIVFS